MKDLITTIIPVYKNKELLLRLLAHNYQFVKNTRIIIVDDASGEGIKEDIQKLYPIIEVIVNIKNKGFGTTVNTGFQMAKTPFILLLNSDVKLCDTSYLLAIDELKKDEKLFAVSFMQLEKNGDTVGKNMFYFKDGFIMHSSAKDKKKGLNGWAEGGACMLNKKYVDELNGFDEIYSPFYWEDIDFSFRAYQKGYNVLFDPSILVEHHHESTIGKYFNKDRVRRIAARNQFIFMWKDIQDSRLIIEHLLHLPIHLFRFLVNDRIFLFGFFDALLRLPVIIKKRYQFHAKIDDLSILQLFQEK